MFKFFVIKCICTYFPYCSLLFLVHITPVMYVDPSGFRQIRGVTGDDYFEYGFYAYQILQEEYCRDFILRQADGEYQNCIRLCESKRKNDYSQFEFTVLFGGVTSGVSVAVANQFGVAIDPLTFFGTALGGFIGGAIIGGAIVYPVKEGLKDNQYEKCIETANEVRNRVYDKYGVER